LISKEITDKNIIDLYWKMVHAGYVNSDKKVVLHNLLGVLQGSGITPLLSNIYLLGFDRFMEKIKAEFFKKGIVSKNRTEYWGIATKAIKARKMHKKILAEYTINKTPEALVMCKENARKAKAILKKYKEIKKNTLSKKKN